MVSEILFNGTENSANAWEIITSGGGGVERQYYMSEDRDGANGSMHVWWVLYV